MKKWETLQLRKSMEWQVDPRWHDPHRRHPQHHRWRWILGWGQAHILHLSTPLVYSPSSSSFQSLSSLLLLLHQLCYEDDDPLRSDPLPLSLISSSLNYQSSQKLRSWLRTCFPASQKHCFSSQQWRLT